MSSPNMSDREFERTTSPGDSEWEWPQTPHQEGALEQVEPVDYDWSLDETTTKYRHCEVCAYCVPDGDKVAAKHWGGSCPVCEQNCADCTCPTCEDEQACHGIVLSRLHNPATYAHLEPAPEWSCQCDRCDVCKLLKKGGWWSEYCGCTRSVEQHSILGLTRALDLSNVVMLDPTSLQFTNGDRVYPGQFGAILLVPNMSKITHPNRLPLPKALETVAKPVAKHAKSARREAYNVLLRARGPLLELQWSMTEPRHVDVATPEAVRRMLKAIVRTPRAAGKPALAFDLEAVNLGREGQNCYIQVRDIQSKLTYLVDLIVLGPQAFQYEGPGGVTLHSILEDKAILKLIWDVRKDSEALFAAYGVRLQGIVDVQVMAMLAEPEHGGYRPSAAVYIKNLTNLTECERHQWNRAKNFKFDGDYSVFARRPIDPALVEYAVTDVRFLANAYEEILPRLGDVRMGFAMDWAKFEVERSCHKNIYDYRNRTHPNFRKYWPLPKSLRHFPDPSWPPPPPPKSMVGKWVSSARAAIAQFAFSPPVRKAW